MTQTTAVDTVANQLSPATTAASVTVASAASAIAKAVIAITQTADLEQTHAAAAASAAAVSAELLLRARAQLERRGSSNAEATAERDDEHTQQLEAAAREPALHSLTSPNLSALLDNGFVVVRSKSSGSTLCRPASAAPLTGQDRGISVPRAVDAALNNNKKKKTKKPQSLPDSWQSLLSRSDTELRVVHGSVFITTKHIQMALDPALLAAPALAPISCGHDGCTHRGCFAVTCQASDSRYFVCDRATGARLTTEGIQLTAEELKLRCYAFITICADGHVCLQPPSPKPTQQAAAADELLQRPRGLRPEAQPFEPAAQQHQQQARQQEQEQERPHVGPFVYRSSLSAAFLTPPTMPMPNFIQKNWW